MSSRENEDHFGGIISRHRVSSDPAKVKALMEMPPPKTKRELQLFLGILNSLSKLSPLTLEVCEPFRRMKPVNDVWTWNKSYKEIYKRAKSMVKEDIYMKY